MTSNRSPAEENAAAAAVLDGLRGVEDPIERARAAFAAEAELRALSLSYNLRQQGPNTWIGQARRIRRLAILEAYENSQDTTHADIAKTLGISAARVGRLIREARGDHRPQRSHRPAGPAQRLGRRLSWLKDQKRRRR